MTAFSVFEESHKWFQKNSIDCLALAKTTSTNDLAKEECFSISTPLKIYLADQQTSGRGRGTATWSNVNPGQALLASFSFDVMGPPQPITSPLVGLYVFEALKNTFPTTHFSLKAPNDVFLKEKKLAGLLVEISQMGDSYRLIIGLGLNVFAAPSAHPHATFLGREVDIDPTAWEKFLSDLITGLNTVARGCLATHLSESERARLLSALNENPNLVEKFESVSPFGDLVSSSHTTSWRNL